MMKLLVAYFNLRNGGRHGRERIREHAIDPITGDMLCGGSSRDKSEQLLWKVIHGEPRALCEYCQELTDRPSDAERLNAWNDWAKGGRP